MVLRIEVPNKVQDEKIEPNCQIKAPENPFEAELSKFPGDFEDKAKRGMTVGVAAAQERVPVVVEERKEPDVKGVSRGSV